MSAQPVTRARADRPVVPAVTIRPAPRTDPPFDDELPPVPWLGREGIAGYRGDLPGQLVLDLTGAEARRKPRSRRPTSAPSPPPAAGRTGSTTEARIAARRFVATCVEVLDGYRPANHLRPLTSPLEYARVCAEIARAGRRGRTGPGRPAPTGRVRLRELRVCEPRHGVAEIAAVLGRGPTVWAMAIRLERRHTRWQCCVCLVL